MLDGNTPIEAEYISCGSVYGFRAATIPLSRPAPGRSLGATVTRIERPVRDAIKILSSAVVVDKDVVAYIFDCTVYGPGYFREPDDLRLSWFLVNVAITHAFLMHRDHVGPFAPALEWFFGEIKIARRLMACFSHQQVKATEDELRNLDVTDDLLDLLPYVIEPHGHVTRNNLETCEIARKTRDVKKDAGVYYTPSDVADFMVESLAALSGAQGSWIDPACGTGVFLRAALAQRRNSGSDILRHSLCKFALSSVFGMDKSALATDLAAFVVFIECSRDALAEQPYFHIWQQIKGNIVCMDALRLVPRGGVTAMYRDPTKFAEIKDIFSAVGEAGFDHVVMNPPYATVRVDHTLQKIWHSFSDISVNQTGDAHLAFTEMLWRLTSENGISAAVLPLSIGTNTTRSYLRLRKELLGSYGTKEFLFFDREPQALFGEDIKTRNLILIRHDPSAAAVRTSRLLKWTAEQRPSIFRRDRLVDIDAYQCELFVPKLGTKAEALVYSHLKSSNALKRAASFAPRVGRLTLERVVAVDHTIRPYMLLVSSTAYNFINCFFSDALPLDSPRPYSSSPVNTLLFDSEEEAYAAFALLSSRLCFWLWHVEGDGFHLTGDFLKRLPLWRIFGSKAAKQRLSKHGERLWQAAICTMVGAVNGGKQTYSFHCGYDHPSAIDVEHVLLKYLGLSNEFTRVLDDFIQANVSIDGKCRMRRTDSKLKKVI